MANYLWHRVAILPDLDNKHFELVGRGYYAHTTSLARCMC
jgi:hypothetical protein